MDDVASETGRPGRTLGLARGAGVVLVLASLAYPFALPWLSDHPGPRVVPAVANLYLFGVFAWSLRRGPPLIERFARIVEQGDLPDFTLPYCRRVTVVWCAFFAGNAAIILALATLAPPEWWSAYTGILVYGLVGGLLVGEACVRKWWFRYYGSGVIDRAFARVFPPEATPHGRRSLAYVAARNEGVTRAVNSPTLDPDHDRPTRPA